MEMYKNQHPKDMQNCNPKNCKTQKRIYMKTTFMQIYMGKYICVAAVTAD